MLKIFYTSDFSNSLSILSGSYLFTYMYLDLPIYLIYYRLTSIYFPPKSTEISLFEKSVEISTNHEPWGGGATKSAG